VAADNAGIIQITILVIRQTICQIIALQSIHLRVEMYVSQNWDKSLPLFVMIKLIGHFLPLVYG